MSTCIDDSITIQIVQMKQIISTERCLGYELSVTPCYDNGVVNHPKRGICCDTLTWQAGLDNLVATCPSATDFGSCTTLSIPSCPTSLSSVLLIQHKHHHSPFLISVFGSSVRGKSVAVSARLFRAVTVERTAHGPKFSAVAQCRHLWLADDTVSALKESQF